MLDENPVPYGMYYVDKEYINALREKEPRIIDPEVTNLYCGPVLRVDDVWAFYAPVFTNPDKNFYADLDENALISGFINIVKMIPCYNKILTRAADSSPEGEFCIMNRTFIESCARYVFEVDKELHEKKRRNNESYYGFCARAQIGNGRRRGRGSSDHRPR